MVVACSGGSDSVGLAAALAALARPRNLTLTLAHVNHGTRESAWQDEAVVLRVSAALGMPLRVRALQGCGPDEAALRDARYAALAGIARDCEANAIATGHNAEDQTETVLMALFRGTGPDGLAGMPPRRLLADGIELARPLLRIERASLRAYVQQAALPYALDPSNDDTTLRRNAVREALQALRPLFPGLDAAVSRASELVGAELCRLPQAAVRRQIREVLRQHEALRDVDFAHVESAVHALQRGRSGRFEMARGVRVTVADGDLTVERTREK